MDRRITALALVIGLVVLAAPAAAQDEERHYVYLPNVRFEPTPVVPHCRVLMHTDFESDLGGWTFGSEGRGERTRADLPLEDAGPWVAQLRPGTDGVVALTSPEFEAPTIAGLEKRLLVFFWHRNLKITTWGTARIVSSVLRWPPDGDRWDTMQVGSATPAHTEGWFQGGGGGLTNGVWTGWPKIRARVGALSDGTSDVVWQIDSLQVELCYRRPFRSTPLSDRIHLDIAPSVGAP